MTVIKRRAIGVGLLAIAASLIALSAPALADVRTGSVTDPTGDAAYAQQDVTAGEVSYDTQGSMTAKVTFSAPPAADTFGVMVIVQLFKSTGPSCQSPGTDFNAVLTVPRAPQDLPPSAAIVRPTPQDVNPPTFTQAGNVVTVQVTDPRIANQPWDCALVGGGTPGPQINVQDSSERIALGGGTPPPPPPPPPPAPPAVTEAKLRPTTLAAARRGSTFARRGKGRLTFTLSAAATVNVTLERRSGRRWRRVKGSVSLNLPAGANALRFTGRWRGRRLARGRYRLVLAPSGPSGAGQIVRVAFRIRR